jgi:hypothetical protein
MSGEPAAGSARVYRRSLLGSTIAAVGILAVGRQRATAQPKISKIAVNYQDHPDGDKRCDRCVQFLPPDACKVVNGTISPQGSCRIFVPGHTPT